jgi:hypothetical protein
VDFCHPPKNLVPERHPEAAKNAGLVPAFLAAKKD